MAAGDEQQQAHRPGAYKQKNKLHKHGKHRTKGEIGRENKGKCDEFIKKYTRGNRHEGSASLTEHVFKDPRREQGELILKFFCAYSLYV